MLYGWTGTNLEVDLTQNSVQKVKGDPELVRTLLGGKGINAKILWDRVPPEVAPFSPENLLIFGTGILCGTTVPAANRTTITYKSPMTESHSWSGMGGFFAPELKHAGYDTIIIRGRSPTPVYLWINSDHVELRDARHLWGKGTHETHETICRELNNEKVQIACIGSAGENRVYSASIEHRPASSASHGGSGAIMGDKKLKAIVVYGSSDVSVAQPAHLLELCDQVLNRTDKIMERAKQWVSLIPGHGVFAPGNLEMTTEAEENTELLRKLRSIPKMVEGSINRNKKREVACYNCELACKWTLAIPGGGFAAYKCASIGAALCGTKIVDGDVALKMYSLFEKYGFDSFAVSNEMAFAIDLYQRGILTKEDTDDMHLEFGNPDVAFWLLEKIARREGIGDVLANGVYRAAKQIGRGAEKYAHYARKQDSPLFDFRGRPKYVLEQAVNDKGDITRLEGGGFHLLWHSPREERESYVKEGWFHYPKEFEKYLMTDPDLTNHDYDYEGYVQVVAYNEEVYTLLDAAGICYWWGGWWGHPAIENRAQLAEIISAATGMKIDEAEATKIAHRIISLVRASMGRDGIGRKENIEAVDKGSFGKPSRKGDRMTDKALDPSLLEKWLDRYNEIRGQNKEGIPTKETLVELGLDDVRQDLEQREILRETPVKSR